MSTTTTTTSTSASTLVSTTSIQQQVGTVLNNNISNSQYNLGNFVTNVNILPFLPSTTIMFSATGLKPNTRLYAYFGGVAVSAWCAPVLTGYAQDTLADLSKAAVYGTALYSDAYGNCIGIFRIPENTFQSQQNIFELNDVSNLTQGADAITTQCDGTFYGSTLSVASGASLLNTRQTVLSSTEVTQQQTVQGLVASSNPAPTQTISPPTSSTFAGGGSGGSGGTIICTALYELGLMNKDLYEADAKFGKYMEYNEPEIYNGYLAWAHKVVSWLNGFTPNVFFWITNKEKRKKAELAFIKKATLKIVMPWAHTMANTIDNSYSKNKTGERLMAIGSHFCKFIDKYDIDINEKLLFVIFYIIYLLV